MSGDLDSFRTVGAHRYRSVLQSNDIARIGALFESNRRPGKRLGLRDMRGVADLISSSGPVGSIAAELLGPAAMPVRALLLDKSESTNWSLGWHQDRTIAVQERVEMPGFGPWSIKAGQLHVQPPHEITAGMVTLRVHLDDVDPDNAPLQVLAGSHALGRLANSAVDELAACADKLICLADSSDVWAYSTPIVHASAEQRRPGQRRVLQIDYSVDELPGGLQWAKLL